MAALPYTVIGHRGARAVVAENTLAGFRYAREHGVHAVELDVRLSRDGELFCLHDPLIAGTPLVHLDAEAVDALRFHGGHGLPRLATVLDLLPPTAAIVEVKSVPGQPDYREDRAAAQAVAALLDARHEAGIADLIAGVSSFDAGSVAAFQEASAHFADRAALLAGPRVRAAWLLAEARRLGVTQVHPHAGLVLARPSLPAAAREAGLTVTCWTVNSPRTARRLLRGGVAAVITDDPVAMAAALGPTGGRAPGPPRGRRGPPPA